MYYITQVVTTDYYLNTYKGRDGDNLDVVIRRSEEIIDSVSNFAVSQFQSLTPFQQDYVMLSVCAQTEYILANGGMDFIDSRGSQWATVGHFTTYSQRMSGDGKSSIVSDRSVMFLEQAGLIYCGLAEGVTNV